jgi:hypothetical protein
VVLCALLLLINYKDSKIKSTTRTIRISRQLDKLLEKEAANKRVSVNSLISYMITKYAEWDRYVESLHFVAIPPDGLRLIIGSLDDEKVKEIGQQIGSRHLQEFMMLWFKKISIDSFFNGLTLFCRYSGMAKYDMDIIDGREYVVVMNHDLGGKWSIFMKYLLEDGMKKTLNIIPKIDITESSVVLRFAYS